ncbi:hypothetical protein [Streptomyces sp. NPDC005407]|uniref:hypothetical protein n=1 Tax=Streptomyces sp. NPDC005407 TaxID=3155340 RepID=UPI0033AD4CEE
MSDLVPVLVDDDRADAESSLSQRALEGQLDGHLHPLEVGVRPGSLAHWSHADDRAAAADEARRFLRPGGRLVVTGWHPLSPADPRLPERHRHTDWPTVLCAADFTAVECHARPAWTDTYQRIYRVALQLGDPGQDAALAGLQSEARLRLPTAHLLSRIAVTAIAG